METKRELSEEIVIVGSRYGDLADVVKPLFEQAEPIEGENIVEVLGGVEVYLSPQPNKVDDQAVGVFTLSQRLLGFVWMYQSPGVSEWIGKRKKRFVKARITRIICRFGIIIAELEEPMQVDMCRRVNDSLDMEWANDLPDRFRYPEIMEGSLTLGIDLLRDSLEDATEWSPRLQMQVDNVLKILPLDLSADNYEQNRDLYMMMRRSPIAEVRLYGEMILSALVSRGSEAQMTWWVEQWLPDSLRLEGNDMLAVFEAAEYTIERIEKLLSRAPMNLFYLYKADRKRFAYCLYYAALPQTLYNRLLTLLAVREVMLEKESEMDSKQNKPNDNAFDEELFHFIHPEVERDEAVRIHLAIKRAVTYQKATEICAYLKELKQKGKVMLPPSPIFMYKELVRLGMPTGKGFSEKYFSSCYTS
ncbi:MAG: hypothetical protein J6E43_06505 [Prevotella sp.]|nr:hypothetical protein [Prevotella sp.]